MNNMITGANTIEEAKVLYAEAKSLFTAASMTLRAQTMAFLLQEDKVLNISGSHKILGT